MLRPAFEHLLFWRDGLAETAFLAEHYAQTGIGVNSGCPVLLVAGSN